MVLEFKLRFSFMFVHEKNWISTRASFVFKQVHFFSIFHSSLADQKKEEGNQLYLAKNYREALQRYNEAISKSYFSYSTAVHGGLAQMPTYSSQRISFNYFQYSDQIEIEIPMKFFLFNKFLHCVQTQKCMQTKGRL